MSRVSTSLLLASVAWSLGAASPAVAQPRCVPVSGKITNNFVTAEGLTLGVISMVYGAVNNGIRLKCALSGVPTTGTSAINFIHSISCDDSIAVPAFDGSGMVPVHSSIVLYTTGDVSGPESPTQLFTFRETSIPIPGAPARGLFYGVNGGQIQVQGAVNKSPVAFAPEGSIDMKFSGQVCYPS
jgi:hypothetical protein